MVMDIAERLVDHGQPGGHVGELLNDHVGADCRVVTVVMTEPAQTAVGAIEGARERGGVPEQFTDPGDRCGQLSGAKAVVTHDLDGLVDGRYRRVQHSCRRS